MSVPATGTTALETGSGSRRSLLLLVAVGYLAYCVLLVARDRDLARFVDSARYTQGAALFDAANPGILTNVVFAPFASDAALVLVQMTIAALAWLLFAYGVLRAIPGDRGYWLAGLVLTYSLTTPVVGWQWAALTEGLAISTFVLWIGLLLVSLSARQRFELWLILSFAAGLLVVLARPQMIVFILPMEVLAIVLAWRRHAHRRYFAGLGLLLLMQVGFFLLRLLALQSVAELSRVYALHNLLGKDSYREYAGIQENCGPVADFMAGVSPSVPGMEALAAECPSTYAWLSSSEASAFRWLLSDPIAAIREFVSVLSSPEQGFVFRPDLLPVYIGQSGALPQSWNDLILPLDFPLKALLALALLTGVFVSLSNSGKWSVSLWRIGAAFCGALGAIAYMLVTWSSDNLEIHRHMFPLLIVLPLLFFLGPSLVARRFPEMRKGASRNLAGTTQQS